MLRSIEGIAIGTAGPLKRVLLGKVLIYKSRNCFSRISQLFIRVYGGSVFKILLKKCHFYRTCML